MSINPSAAQLRQLRRDNLKYLAVLSTIPKEAWPVVPFVESAERVHVLRSRQFLVQVFNDNGRIRMTFNRTEWDERTKRFRDDISWDDLQRLKSEAGYGDAWAVEIFPDDAHVVNVANMRHLWLLDEAPAFAWIREARAT